ncbi:AMP-binding protein [Pseudonocardia xinjiangensis]|uniref:AMP-binding protein n=1 Tax=Pseudonocardia xinjiangensis TaxID=75289 RepID=UPI003D8F08AF
MSNFTIRAPGGAAQEYRNSGIWRDSTPVGDLRRWCRETPDAVAVKAYRAGGGPTEMSSVEIGYAEYGRHVERFAGALYELGVRPGQVVSCQLPNWWQAGALLLAAMRLQAVLAPVMTTIRPRELERVLARVGASVVVTVDEWAGFDHAAALREMAPRLPQLRHRVVLGKADDGEIEFGSFFEDTPWEQRHPVALDDAVEDPDQVAAIFFTSGTSGEPKGALHTHNTLYATVSAIAEENHIGPRDVLFTPHSSMHLLGHLLALLPLSTGACSVLLDSWSGERGAAVLSETGSTVLIAAPFFVEELITAGSGQPQHLPALRIVGCGATTVPRPLVAEVPRVFGVPLQSGWGMTELGVGTLTSREDPPDWPAHSDGRPLSWAELDLRSDTEITVDRPGRLYARGGGVCLATLGRDSGALTVIAEHEDGWFDTGDLAVPDGRGGIRLMGRAGDRIGGAFMIPVNDVESELLTHPGVADVALVGYPDGHGGELACAVVVAAGSPPVTLEELRAYLTGKGMTDWYLPSRLELVGQLPRNDNGKVRKELLRRELQTGAALTTE